MSRYLQTAGFVSCVTLGSVFAVGTNTWNNAVAPGGNAPTNAYDWADAANWTDASYVPGYWGDGAKLPNHGTAPRFIAVPDLTRLTYIGWGPYNHILGNIYYGDDDAGTVGARQSVDVRSIIYGDLQTCSVKYGPYVGPFAIAGYYRNKYNKVEDRTPFSRGNYAQGRTGTLTMRMDLWADSADPVRTAPFLDGGFSLANASFDFYGPRGAAAQDSAWELTAASTYARYAGSGKHTVVPGMVVTGPGVPTDGDPVFVRYVFTDTGWIELSAPATAAATGASASLHFAAITPSVQQYFLDEDANNGGPHRIRAIKYREEDGCRLYFRAVVGSGGQYGRRWGLTKSDVETSHLIPGDIVISNTASWKPTNGVTNWLDVCRLEIPCAHAEMEKLFWTCGDECDARLTVRAGDAGVMPNFIAFRGKTEKRGAGKLTIKVIDSSSSGAITVSEGTLKLVSATGRPFAIGALTLRAGTVLELPSEGLTAQSLAIEAGAVLRGPGTLYYDLPQGGDYAGGAVTLQDGARLTLRGGVSGARITAKPVAQVVGHPAFWVDASKPETIVTNEAGGVTRWNDCRAGEPMFCTNIVYAPRYVYGAQMTNRYVHLRRRATTYGWVTNTEVLAWSVPVKDVRAVFMMQDPTDGGGDLLGRTARLPNGYYSSQGGPFYRGQSQPYSSALVYKAYGCPSVTNGWFYLNGSLVNGTTTGYLGAFMHLVECHINTAYRANTNYKELYIDAFGTGYGDGGLKTGNNYFIDAENGNQRIAECLVYTNTLTYAERAQVAQYLMNKWLGKDVVYQEFDPRYVGAANGAVAAANACVEVADGDVRFVTDVAGAGDLVKTGAGLLHVDAMPSGALDVAAGEVIVESLFNDPTAVPGDPWMHFDAASPATVVTNAQGGVTRWNDVRGNGFSARPIYENATKARYVADTVNGNAVLDCGAAANSQTGGASFRFYKPDGSFFPHSNEIASGIEYPGYVDADQILEAFFVVGSKNGGGSLLGSWKDGYPMLGLPHASTTAKDPVLVCPASFWWAYGTLYNNISNGTTVARLNGERFNPIVTPFSGGYDLISFQNLRRKSDALAIYGQSGTYSGGLEYGEVLLYTNRLDTTDFRDVEAYLAKRWFNRLTSGSAPAEVSALRVAEDARVEVRGSQRITTDALAGAGTVAGDVTLAEQGVFQVYVDEQGVAQGPLAIDGTLALPAAASVVFTGPGRLGFGTYELATASTLTGNASAWTVADPGRSRRAHVKVENNRLLLVVSPCGTMLILR